jgi:hypothetical protein
MTGKSGTDMLATTLLRAAGFDPKEIFASFEAMKRDLPTFANNLKNKVDAIDARLSRIESGITSLAFIADAINSRVYEIELHTSEIERMVYEIYLRPGVDAPPEVCASTGPEALSVLINEGQEAYEELCRQHQKN